jgi:hypothetical protein
MWLWSNKSVPPENDRAILLGDWPQPAVVAQPRLFADEHQLSLIYRLANDRFAVIHFPHCGYFAFGEPNDEALGGHPLMKCGLQHYSVFEIVNSSLIQRLERQNSVHPRHDRNRFLEGLKHFVFTFQDSTLEVVANTLWEPPIHSSFDQFEEADQEWRTLSSP